MSEPLRAEALNTQMNLAREWLEANNRFLAAALTWLRLRLRRLAEERQTVVPVEKQRGPFFLFRNRSELVVSTHVSAGEIEQAGRAMQTAAGFQPPPALYQVAEQFHLDDFERNLLLLCAAMELDPSLPGLCSKAQGDVQRAYPTFALALDLFPEDASWSALSPEGPLRAWRLVEVIQTGAQPLTAAALRVDERIASYLKGLNFLDERLDLLMVPFDTQDDGASLPPSQEEALQVVIAQLRSAAGRGRLPVIQLVGADTLSKQIIAQRTAAEFGLRLLRLPVMLLPAQQGDVEALARLWQRESLLQSVALYLDARDDWSAPQGEGAAQSLHRLLAHDLGVVLLDTREVQPGLTSGGLPVDVDRPTPAEQQVIWQAALGPNAGDLPALLAGQFNLSVPAIRAVVAGLQPRPGLEQGGGQGEPASETLWGVSPTPDGPAANSDGPGDGLRARVWNICLARSRPRLDQLAQRIEPKATWREIVLPRQPLRLLFTIARQVAWRTRVYDEFGFRRRMNRGLGISALFAGESGTGKTMAAEVIANHLCLNLYRIDLSAVVSKYIGETEKNLRRLFDAAEDGGTILFFDEADALFGKRSEVKDSHDRYANIEVNYLLQRMEAYSGLAILATNLKGALDFAFLRRLRFIVNFPFPTLVDRARIWRKAFPPETPVELADPALALDFDGLARLNLTGGSIHNVALSAAFLAARSGKRVTMPLVLDAARTEFRKLDKPVNEADFNWKPKVPARPRPAGAGGSI